VDQQHVGVDIRSRQQASPTSMKNSFGVFESCLLMLANHGGSRRTMKLASRIDSQSLAVFTDTPVSEASVE
jgi:hypothetical protein